MQFSERQVKYWPAILVLGLVAGCARFHPQPLSPAETATGLESRSLDNPGLKVFLEKNLNRELNSWPAAKWRGALMPWAMFLNYSYRTEMTGVALHAAIGQKELVKMGQRASGGCVRLPLEKADALFHRFRKGEQGMVPVFAFDEGRGTTNVDGIVAGDDGGHIYLADGVKVLVVIENFSGENKTAQK